MTLSLGIDPSIAATGLVLLTATIDCQPSVVFEREIKPPSKLRGIARQLYIVTEVMMQIHNYDLNAIVVEGYSLNMRNASSVVPLCELGGLLRAMMHLDGLRWHDPRASELKKFVTGKGTSPKSQMMMSVLKRWKHESLSDNTADAYGLACMGLALEGQLQGATKEQLTIVGAVPSRTT